MSQANQAEREMLDLINADRASFGLNPLQLNTALNDAAEDHSAWMLGADVFSHTGQGESTAGERMEDAAFPFEGSYGWAENIGWQSERGAPGISDDVADIHESLMNSPGHRANLLDPNLTEIGIGIEEGAFTTDRGTFDSVMVTQNFAATDGDISALRDPGTGGADVVTPPEPAPEVKETPPLVSRDVDDVDAFEFTQTTDTSSEMTDFDAFWADLFAAFGLTFDATPDPADADAMPMDAVVVMDMTDFVFDCA